jgi:hypothetical protein
MIRIRLPVDVGEEHVAFIYSPLLECVLSLHVLIGPRHHAIQHSWVREMRALDPRLKRRIEAFGFLYRYTFPDLVIPGARSRSETFERELDLLCRHPPALLLEAFARPLVDHGGRYGEHVLDEPAAREMLLKRAGADAEPTRQLVQLLVDDPTEFARRFASLRSEYWQADSRTNGTESNRGWPTPLRNPGGSWPAAGSGRSSVACPRTVDAIRN